MELFTRPSDDEKYLVYKLNISKLLNKNNFLSMNKFKIKKFLDINEEQHFLRYRLELFRDWMKENFRYSKECINKIDSILRKTMLINALYPNEEAFIYSLRNIVFAKNRNLKSLLTDLRLSKTEQMYYFYQLNRFVKDGINKSGFQICLTNHNIYLRENTLNFEKIHFKSIYDLHLCDDHLIIQTTMNKYEVFVPDPKLLYVSIERILNIKKFI